MFLLCIDLHYSPLLFAAIRQNWYSNELGGSCCSIKDWTGFFQKHDCRLTELERDRSYRKTVSEIQLSIHQCWDGRYNNEVLYRIHLRSRVCIFCYVKNCKICTSTRIYGLEARWRLRQVAYCNTMQTKAVGRQLGNLSDELIARKSDRGNINCSRRLKIGFIIIFYVGVFAKFASSVWSLTKKGIDWKDIMEAVTERLLKINHACTSFLNITWKNRKGCYSGIAVGIWLLSKAR